MCTFQSMLNVEIADEMQPQKGYTQRTRSNN